MEEIGTVSKHVVSKAIKVSLQMLKEEIKIQVNQTNSSDLKKLIVKLDSKVERFEMLGLLGRKADKVD